VVLVRSPSKRKERFSMRTLRSGVVVALVLVSAIIVVVASPAFATPNLTTSTSTRAGRPDNGAASPFVTPVGAPGTNSVTISQRTEPAGRRGVSFQFRTQGRTPLFVTCAEIQATAFAGTTHTRLTISDRFPFLGYCYLDGGGEIPPHVVVGVSAPYFLHITRNLAANTWQGALEIRSSFGIQITFSPRRGSVCELSIRPQSLTGIIITDNLTTIEISDRTAIFSLNSGDPAECPDHRTNNRAEIVSATRFNYAIDTKTTRITATSPVGG
jgi:hypothetical protein